MRHGNGPDVIPDEPLFYVGDRVKYRREIEIDNRYGTVTAVDDDGAVWVRFDGDVNEKRKLPRQLVHAQNTRRAT